MNTGSSLQCSNKDKETPLHVAAVRGYFNLVRYFCERGADLNATDNVRKCAVDSVRLGKVAGFFTGCSWGVRQCSWQRGGTMRT